MSLYQDNRPLGGNTEHTPRLATTGVRSDGGRDGEGVWTPPLRESVDSVLGSLAAEGIELDAAGRDLVEKVAAGELTPAQAVEQVLVTFTAA